MDKQTFEIHDYDKLGLPVKFINFYLGPNLPPAIHWHADIEVLYFYSGSGYTIINNTMHSVNPGDIFIVNANTSHSYWAPEPLKYYCMIIDSEFLKYNSINVQNITFESRINSKEAENLYFKTLEEIHSASPFRVAGIKNAIVNFVLYLLKNHSNLNNETKSTSNPTLNLAVSYIHSHFHQKITVDEILHEIGLSRYYFFHLFKQNFNMTPVQYINKIRCTEAKELLKQRLPIHEVAMRCGFENDSYFTKTFKKHTGYLPSEYSKKHV